MHHTAFTFKCNKFPTQLADLFCLLYRKPKTENRKPYKRVMAVAVIFLVSVVLTNGGTAVSFAAGKKETSKTTAVPSQELKQVFDAHEASGRYHGAGLGASHQTGWTGFIAKQIQFFGLLDPTFLARGRSTGIFYPEKT